MRSADQGMSSMRVLIVDDSAVVRRILTGMFKRLNVVDIDQAENGQVAVDKVSETDYDLVLLDWNMPEKLGIEALEEIRESGNDVPIIMVTTESEKDNIIKAIRAGANSYIVKPFVPGVVLDKIKKVVPDLM